VKCEKCGVELVEYECSRTDTKSTTPHRPSQCIAALQARVATLEMIADAAKRAEERWEYEANRVTELTGRVATLEAAMGKIDAIRNSIIGRQSIHWSMHIYPLVATLDEAGYSGEGYDVARPKAEAEIAAYMAPIEALEAKLKTATEALKQIDFARRRHGHNDTCSYAVGGCDYECDCGANISTHAIAALGTERKE